MLKKSYGVMKIKEGSILYHASDKKFKYNTNKPMLFCTFHPSEWYSKYITRIRIKKDISLFDGNAHFTERGRELSFKYLYNNFIQKFI